MIPGSRLYLGASLPHDLGGGGLSDPPVGVVPSMRRDHDRRGCSRPPHGGDHPDRKRGGNGPPREAEQARRSGGATPPRCRAPELDLAPRANFVVPPAGSRGKKASRRRDPRRRAGCPAKSRRCPLITLREST